MTSVAEEEKREPTDPAVALLRRSRLYRLLRTYGPLIAAIVSSILAYVGADGTAREQSASVKNKAEAGYQIARETLQELRADAREQRERTARLEAEVQAIKRGIRRGSSIKVAPPQHAQPAAPPAPAPLPPDLDRALQVKTPEAPAK